MNEQSVQYTARDGKTIYCTINQAGDTPSGNLIIVGHGLTGSPQQYLHQSARTFFTKHGYDVLRIAYYADKPGARVLSDCTVRMHADDLNLVISEISADYKALFYCGHSYGGLTALLANPDVNATAFWDSTYVPDFWDTEASYIPELDCYKLNWGVEALASKAMYEEAKSLTYERMKEIAASYKTPSGIFIADENEDIVERRQRLYDDLQVDKTVYLVEGAGHCFYEGDTVYDLLENTQKWFDQYKV